MADTRWIERRGRTFYAVKDVPRPLQSAVGRRRFIRSLGTRDLHVALARRHAALAEFERAIAAATARTGSDPMTETGMVWRETFAGIRRGDPSALAAWDTGGIGVDDSGEVVEFDTAADNASDAFYSQLATVRAERGDVVAQGVHDLAHGLATPLMTYADSWLAEGGAKGPLRERTKRQYRSDVAELGAWAKEAGIPPLIESFTRSVAGRYVTDAITRGADRKTLNRKISAVSAYWRWLLRRTDFTVNPWSGQSVPKGGSGGRSGRYKRPFAESEVIALLDGPADQELADAMRVAALSGMRIEESYRLTVADCAGGWFNVRDAKTRAGIRRVPIHSGLAVIVDRRTKGSAATAFLFPEAGPPRVGRERSMAVSKRFGHYRRRLGIEERPEGRRQSSIDFHSWRRWFVTRARAGFDYAVVASIVGHEVGNLTDDTYSGGPTDAVRRACVESVRLPPEGVIR